MSDKIILILGALFTLTLAFLAVTLNTTNSIGPYFIAGLLTVFSLLSFRLVAKEL